MKYPVTFLVKARLLSALVRKTPVFRGHTVALTWLFRLLPVTKQAVMRVGDSTFFMDLSYSTHLSCLRLGRYEPLESVVVKRTLIAGDRFLDVGANWGYFSALASHYVGRSGAVYAIEANPKTYFRFLQMLRISGAGNVFAFNFAVSDSDVGSVDFVAPLIGGDAFGHIDTSGKRGHSQKVLQTSLDSWWNRLGKPVFRMAKIDVEGMEPKVIAGGRECLTHGVTESVLVEINKWTNSRCGESYETCYERLQECGFRYIYEPAGDCYKKIVVGGEPPPCDKTILFTKKALTGVVN